MSSLSWGLLLAALVVLVALLARNLQPTARTVVYDAGGVRIEQDTTTGACWVLIAGTWRVQRFRGSRRRG
jgi:hypothetical protein